MQRGRRFRLFALPWLVMALLAGLLGMYVLAMSGHGAHHQASTPTGIGHHAMLFPGGAAEAVPFQDQNPDVLSAAHHHEPGADNTSHSPDTEWMTSVAGWCLVALLLLVLWMKPPQTALLPPLTWRVPFLPRWIPTPRPARPPSLTFLSISRT